MCFRCKDTGWDAHILKFCECQEGRKARRKFHEEERIAAAKITQRPINREKRRAAAKQKVMAKKASRRISPVVHSHPQPLDPQRPALIPNQSCNDGSVVYRGKAPVHVNLLLGRAIPAFSLLTYITSLKRSPVHTKVLPLVGIDLASAPDKIVDPGEFISNYLNSPIGQPGPPPVGVVLTDDPTLYGDGHGR